MKPSQQKTNPSSTIKKVPSSSKSNSQVLPTKQTSNKTQSRSLNTNQVQSTLLLQSRCNTNNISQINLLTKQMKVSQINVGSKQASPSLNESKVKGQNVSKMILKKEVKQDQKIEEIKDNLLIQISTSNYEQFDFNPLRIEESFESKIKELNPFISQYFQIINDDLSVKIASFLPITDLIAFANISKKARKLVSIVMQANNYIFFNIINDQQYNSSKEFQAVYSLFKLKNSYQQLIKRSLPSLEQIFQYLNLSQIPFQDIILEILAVVVSYSSNFGKSKSNILDHIKEKGIINSFPGLNLNYVTPIQSKIFLPQYPDIRNNVLAKFVKIIHNYVEYQQSNKLSIEKQKLLYKQVQLNYLRQKYICITQKLLPLYKQTILIMPNGSSIYDFANKNTISIIISFLKLQEIVQLMESGKQMKVMIHQILQDQLVQMKSIRQSKMKEIDFNSEIAAAIIYTKHLILFQKENKFKLQEIPDSDTFISLFHAILHATSSFELEGQFTYYSNKALLHLKLCIPTIQEIKIFNNLKKHFPTIKSLKDQLVKEELNRKISRDCILLYYSMLGLISLVKLNITDESWEKFEQDYQKYLFSFDARIHHFEKLIGKNEEDFLIFKKYAKDEYSEGKVVQYLK